MLSEIWGEAMSDKPPFITGWCNDQPGHPPALHHLCRHTYTGQHGQTYVCECPHHYEEQQPERVVKRTLRKP